MNNNIAVFESLQSFVCPKISHLPIHMLGKSSLNLNDFGEKEATNHFHKKFSFMLLFFFSVSNYQTEQDNKRESKLPRTRSVFLASCVHTVFSSEVLLCRQRLNFFPVRNVALDSSLIFTAPLVPGAIHLQLERLLYYHIYQFVLWAQLEVT